MSTEGTVRPLNDASLNRLLAEMLGQQQRLATPVTRVAAAETARRAEPTAPGIHKEMIPLAAPSPGEQYAFEVDLDACSGCKACVAACHSLNGLDETETWRDVGLLVATDNTPWQQTVTTACHHCAEPGCLEGCPVVAYEKDPATGIVRHLDDQCIGCSYCILKCPYDVPKFNPRLGIVRKCDMCHQRLAVGEAPACVQACPTQAIRIVKVEASSGSSPAVGSGGCGCGSGCGCKTGAEETSFLPAAPDPSYTKPTTRYVSKRGLPKNIRAADANTPVVQPAHLPLAVMLAATQLGVGIMAAAPLAGQSPIGRLSSIGNWGAAAQQFAGDLLNIIATNTVFTIGLGLFFAGLGASVTHLGKPLRAWRFFLGLKTSWLSREILVFSAAAPLALLALVLPDSLTVRLLLTVTGLLGVLCSAMIYIDTRRRFWAAPNTLVRFLGTTTLGALAVSLPAAAAAVMIAKILAEFALGAQPLTTRNLLRGPLRLHVVSRSAVAALATAAFAFGLGLPGLALLIAGEIAERILFFKAVDAPKMPGQPGTI